MLAPLPLVATLPHSKVDRCYIRRKTALSPPQENTDALPAMPTRKPRGSQILQGVWQQAGTDLPFVWKLGAARSCLL